MVGPRKIALAYSGGLDTSVAVPWLIEIFDLGVSIMFLYLSQGLEDV